MLAPIPIPVEFASSSPGASIKLLCIQSTPSLLSPASAELVWKNPCVTPAQPMLTEPGISTVGVTVPADDINNAPPGVESCNSVPLVSITK